MTFKSCCIKAKKIHLAWFSLEVSLKRKRCFSVVFAFVYLPPSLLGLSAARLVRPALVLTA